MTIFPRLTAAFAPVEAAIASGRIPGAVLGIVTSTGERAILAAGAAQLVPERRTLDAKTFFDLASLTKVIFTTPRILALAEAGRLDLDAPLTSVIPDFRQYQADSWERKITFRQCLGHRTPLPGVEPLYTYGNDPSTLRAFVLQREWRAGPSVYSDINFILLGIALERLTGQTIRDMALADGLSFRPDPANTAATENCTWRGRVMVGEVHDENCYALQGSGHAGLFGTIDAVLGFARGLLDGSGASPEAIALMRQPLSDKRTHGWERPYTGWSGGDNCSPQTIGHTGFTGTGLWLDFASGTAWSLLTNRVHPSRHADSGIFALRRAVGDIINSAAS
ncbi:MAG TPA: serine hydrolase domain-containing protein [Devosiaceae bacterium]|jgi:CubicO group peptidase (beta-lactamase class C family)